jgi:hypothetical protein
MEWKKINRDGLKYDYFINREGVVKRGNKIMKHNLASNGYLRVSLRKENNTSMCVYIHRILAENFIENPDNKPMVNHKNGNKLDFRIDNLEWTTSSENEKHAYDNGLKFGKIGTSNHKSKLTDNDVIEIKLRLKKGDKPKDISNDYPINEQSIYKIKNGLRWCHIKLDSINE